MLMMRYSVNIAFMGAFFIFVWMHYNFALSKKRCIAKK
jgi:hypothetical protein